MSQSTEILNTLKTAGEHQHTYSDYATPVNVNIRNTQPAHVNVGNPVSSTTPGDMVDEARYTEILNVLQQFLDHQHVYYDDYGTNCNCNCCDCNAIRGAL